MYRALLVVEPSDTYGHTRRRVIADLFDARRVGSYATGRDDVSEKLEFRHEEDSFVEVKD